MSEAKTVKSILFITSLGLFLLGIILFSSLLLFRRHQGIQEFHDSTEDAFSRIETLVGNGLDFRSIELDAAVSKIFLRQAELLVIAIQDSEGVQYVRPSERNALVFQPIIHLQDDENRLVFDYNPFLYQTAEKVYERPGEGPYTISLVGSIIDQNLFANSLILLGVISLFCVIMAILKILVVEKKRERSDSPLVPSLLPDNLDDLDLLLSPTDDTLLLKKVEEELTTHSEISLAVVRCDDAVTLENLQDELSYHFKIDEAIFGSHHTNLFYLVLPALDLESVKEDIKNIIENHSKTANIFVGISALNGRTINSVDLCEEALASLSLCSDQRPLVAFEADPEMFQSQSTL